MPAKALAAALAATLFVALTPRDANAVTCYIVFDRNENITYRDVYPPVDLSEAGRPQREAMRRRGEFMMFLETDQCPRLEYFTGDAGSIGVAMDQVLPPTGVIATPQASPARKK